MGAGRANETQTAEFMTSLRSPVNWAVLGLVIQRGSYGYELVQRFERTYPQTLALSSRSLIYTALDNLARHGLIEHAQGEREHDPVRQPKLSYRATEQGICTYERWLASQVSEDPRRSHLIAQHFASLSPKQAQRVLDRCADLSLEAAGSLSAEEDPQRREGLAQRLAAEEARLRAGAILSWIEYARTQLCAGTGRRGR